MKKLDFNYEVTDLKGVPFKEYVVKEAVANMLASQSTAKPVKSMELARKIMETGIIEVTSEDALLIENCITSHQTTTDLVKEQLLKAFE